MRKLLLGTLLMSTSVGMAQLVVPLYAKSLGASYTEIGLLGLGYIILNVALSIPVGRASDRRGRVGFLTVGYMTTAIAFAAYYLVAAVWWLIVVRIIQGATETAMWINVQGLVTDMSRDAERGKAMGHYSTAFALGIGIGPVIGGLLYTKIGTATFMVTAAIALASFFVMLTLKSGEPKVKAADKTDKSSVKGIWPVYLVAMLNFGIISVLSTILPVYSTSSLRISDFQTGMIITMFALTRGVLFTPMGRMSDKVGHRRIILLGTTAVSIALLGFAFAMDLPGLVALMLILGVPASIVYPTILSAASKAANGQNIGYVMGIFNAIGMTGWGIFSGVGGVLADAYGPVSPFIMCAAVSLLMVPILWKALPRN